jgi:hypothetical protein
MIYLIKELVLAFKIANKIKNSDWDKEIRVLDDHLVYGSEYWKCKVLYRVIDKNNPSNSLDFMGKNIVCYDRFGDYLIVNKMGWLSKSIVWRFSGLRAMWYDSFKSEEDLRREEVLSAGERLFKRSK